MDALPRIAQMVNEALIARCIREEPKAQYELYRALYGLMMGVCSRYTRNRDDAASLMNQGFLKILRNLDRKRSEVPLEAWVRRILINTVIDAHRKDLDRKRHETMEEAMDQLADPDVNEYLTQMESEAIAALLERVPDMSRKVFNLFAIDGYSHAEIATLLGISDGTSKWHVSHARRVLQQAIAAKAIAIQPTIR
ncbi:MAG: RNA polymerase sigma factor [Flavobacteriales bacterium]|nr:RNA polymerase sigma factor [Flavobacteriales bacterium]